MGILDSIKDRFGGGSDEPVPPESKMRQPPGRDAPDTGPEAGPGPAPAEGRGPEPPAGRGPDEPARQGPRGEAPPERGDRPGPESPGGGRGGRGSTLDIERGDERGPPGGGGDDLDFEPPGDAPGGDRPPEPPAGRGGGPEEPGPGGPGPGRGRREERHGRDDSPGDMPEPPRDYNLDLPEPGGGGDDRLDRIEEQNERIIDLLQDIRDNMGGGRPGGRR